MKKKKMAALVLISAVLGTSLGTSFCSAAEEASISYPDPRIKANLPKSQPTVQEDFYVNINYDELKSLELPKGYSNYSVFDTIMDQAKDNLLTYFKEASGESDKNKDTNLSKVISYYQMYTDMESRNAKAWDNVRPYVEKVEAIETMEDYFELVYSDPVLALTDGTYSYMCEQDIKDSSRYSFYMSVPSLYLGDSAEYKELTELGEVYKAANEEFFQKILTKYGYTEDVCAEIIKNQYAWEELLAPYLYETEVSYRPDYMELTYNPYTLDELTELTKGFPMKEILEKQGEDGFDQYILDQPDYFEKLSELYTEENLPFVKANLIINILVNACETTDEEAFGYFNDWNNAKNGSSGMRPLEDYAYDFVCEELKELVGDIYGKTFFGAEAKKTAEEMTYKIIEAMRVKLEKEEWMSEETRKTALEKVDAVSVYIGYPESFYYDYSKFLVDPELDLYSNAMNMSIERKKQNLAKCGTEVNPDTWGNIMAANEVNACYIPTSNCICFPAAILQAPFFDPEATISQNLGGIGTVIGHELTHAFDTQGSQFDKDGNMKNWWKEEDLKAFTELTDKVGACYGQYATVGDSKVNGDLTIGETVADLGGASLAIDVMHKLEADGEQVDYKEFFTTNAKIWSGILTKESALNRLKNDPHAPACLRVNVNLAQFDEFYETFDIKEGDAMYTAPENRLTVW